MKKTYGSDREFLARHLNTIELHSGDCRLLLTADLQGRVLTSTADGDNGYSFGWLNYDLISSGRTLPHCNNWGGEDRFWLGPEGGQYSLFFPEGTDFSFAQWQTPAPIDTEGWELISHTATEASFRKECEFVNTSGTVLKCRLERRVVLEPTPAGVPDGVKCIRFRTENSITNIGSFAWTRETGMPSIWILGQFTPSQNNSITIPYRTADGCAINDRYFGRIESERLADTGDRLLFRADGRKRGKIGIPYEMCVPKVWALDADHGVLTVAEFSLPAEKRPYVNSMWEYQQEPFAGDVLNTYNDGPLEDGSIMGPFYELESSSPAAELQPGQTLTHLHTTTHYTGDTALLKSIVE